MQRNRYHAIIVFLHFNNNSIYNAKDLSRGIVFRICALMEYPLKSSVFNATMQRNRYQAIIVFLHFNNNSIYNAKDLNRDILFRICALMEYFACRFHRFSTSSNPPSIEIEPLKQRMYTFVRDKKYFGEALAEQKGDFILLNDS